MSAAPAVSLRVPAAHESDDVMTPTRISVTSLLLPETPGGRGRQARRPGGCGFARSFLRELPDGRLRRAVARAVAERDDRDQVSDLHVAGFADNGEQTFARHHAVAGLVVDGALGVADLADLADLEDGPVADRDHRAHRQGQQVDADGRDVLGEVAGTDVEPLGDYGVDGLLREQGDLAMPVARVGVTFEAPVQHEGSRDTRSLAPVSYTHLTLPT